MAGTVLGDLLSKKHSVLIIDQDSGQYGSRVAAGIYNPVTGRRMVKAWMTDTFSEFAKGYYRSKETQFGKTLLHEMNVKRLFHNELQRREWLEKVDFYQIEAIIEGEIEPNANDAAIDIAFGGVETNGSWRLDTATFLEASRKEFIEFERLVQADITYDQIVLESDGTIRAKKYVGNRVIFCEGWQMVKNPWFGYLPLTPNKGELLLIHAPGLNQYDLLQKGMFVLPVGDDYYKVGATYNRDDQSYQTTDAAKAWLVERLERVIKTSYKIIDQKAGIRPTVRDRRPLIGQHPKHAQLYVFNGFGSKGVSQIPWCAHHFSDFLSSDAQLLTELSIERFSKSGFSGQ